MVLYGFLSLFLQFLPRYFFVLLSSNSRLISTKFGTWVPQAIGLIGSDLRWNWCSGHRTLSDLLYGFLSLFPPFHTWLRQNLAQKIYKQLCWAHLSFFRIGAVEAILYLYLYLWSYAVFRPYSFRFSTNFKKILLLRCTLIWYDIFVNRSWVDTQWQ
jgi:hypothetical protein